MPGPGRRFQKGQSGNPSGRPKSDQTVVEMARAHCPEAIATLVEIMGNRKATASARALAAEHILSRGYGRPPQVNTIVAAPTRRAADLTDDELAAIILGLTDAEEQPLLVGPELEPDAACAGQDGALERAADVEQQVSGG